MPIKSSSRRAGFHDFNDHELTQVISLEIYSDHTMLFVHFKYNFVYKIEKFWIFAFPATGPENIAKHHRTNAAFIIVICHLKPHRRRKMRTICSNLQKHYPLR